MNTQEKIDYIVKECKGAVWLTFNEHRDNYQTIPQYFDVLILCGSMDKEDISEDILNEMIKRDTLISLIMCTSSTNGHYDLYHYDLEQILNKAIELI